MPVIHTLASAVDAHGNLVTLERIGAEVMLNAATTTLAFEPADETQHAGLVALHDALGALLGTSAPWLVSRLDREDDPEPVTLPDEFAVTDNVFALDGERVRVVWVSHYARTLYVRPERAEVTR